MRLAMNRRSERLVALREHFPDEVQSHQPVVPFGLDLTAVLGGQFGSQKRGTHVHGRILVLMG